ncbi:hypothetical protein PAECIP111893_03829 [Paenibacillus plantiphilus]|uniref:DUF2269 domain-containing protein n=1 Tax=Paenibacillus plantiphilus TaxID=2905650 RepID=A0ABM9CJM9_9BACL|nr:hypothetical protein [Paenibacillus plantiphilus]CAH1214655.1 hypothetical protein PAECIP111893_03829 [Paenibacillus plantiphilus]
MILSPSLRKLVLTVHVITTMGWIGSAAAYIPIAAYVLNNQDADMVRSAIQIMSLIANFIVVPVAFASLLTGVALSLGTRWGLFRHYWILFKLLFTVLAVVMLVAYIQELSHAASIASKSTLSNTEISILKDSIHIVHPSGGLLIVLVATVLSVYKPKGMTRHGWRKQLEIKSSTVPYTIPIWIKMVGSAVVILHLLIVALILFN